MDYPTFVEMKDYCLFAISKLLFNCQSSAVVPASVTEQHLANVTRQEISNNNGVNQANLLTGRDGTNPSDRDMTAFQLRIEVSLQKTFLNMTASILNCLLLSKKLIE